MNEVASFPSSRADDGWKTKVWSQIRGGASLLRCKPFDTASQNGRSKERYRRVLLTAVTTAAARGTSLLTMLISVPLIVRQFGAERYALWATITSTVTLLVFADLGVGNGLLNAISESHGTEDRENAKCYVSTAFFVLLAIALVSAFVFAVVYPSLPWKRLFNVRSTTAMQEAGPSAAIFIFCFLAQLPLGVVQRVQLGYQEGFVTQIWAAAGNLFGLVALLWLIHLGVGLPFLVLAVAGSPVLAGLLNTVIHFSFRQSWLIPRVSQISQKAARRILSLGFFFLILQVAGTIGFQTDNLILAQLLGPESVTVYSVATRLFTIIPAVLFLVMIPLWPAYGEASTRGDGLWVSQTLRRSLMLGLIVSSSLGLSLVAAGPWIIRVWIGGPVAPSSGVLIGLAIWAVVANGISVPLAMFSNGVGFIRVQAICSTLMAVSNVLLSIYLTHRIGIPGVIYGSIISQTIFLLIPYGFFVPRLLAAIGSGTTVFGVAPLGSY